MSSTSGGRSLPAIKPPDQPRRGDNRTGRNQQPREISREGKLSQQRVSNGPKVPRGRQNHQHSQTQRHVALHDDQHQSRRIHSRSLSEASDGSRNWNSEGGRPKRDRTYSDRSNTRRLLHRSSVNSVGELIPFQRAPRDGSYESQLPVAKKASSQRLAIKKETTGELPIKGVVAKDRQSSNLGQRRQSVLKTKSSGDRKDPSKVPRSGEDEESSTGKRSDGSKSKAHTQHEVTRQGRTLPKEGIMITNGGPTQPGSSTRSFKEGDPSSNNIKNEPAAASVEENSGPNFHFQNKHNEFASPPGLSNFLSDSDDDDEPVLGQNGHFPSPSAEFRVAAQQQQNVASSSTSLPCTSTVSATSTDSVTLPGPLSRESDNSGEISIPSSNIESNVTPPLPQNTSQQPNSVIRQRMNSGEMAERTGQLQVNEVSAPLLAPFRLEQTSSRNETPLRTADASSDINPSSVQDSVEAGSPRISSGVMNSTRQPQPPSRVGSLQSPRTNVAQPPSTVHTNLETSDNDSIATSEQSRLSRFGRRIRMPSTEDTDPPSQEASQASDEPVTNGERFDGTHSQRYRFFSMSRERSEPENAPRVPFLNTPNRDLLYGLSSPPRLRRHQRTHFGDGTSSLLNSRGEQGASSSLSSSIRSDNLDLGEDSFRTSSRSTTVSPPVLQHLLDGRSSSSASRQRLHQGPPPNLIPADRRFTSNDNNSQGGHQTQPPGNDDRSSDEEEFTFSVDEGSHLSRDARRRYQSDRTSAIPRLLPQRSLQPSRDLSRGADIMENIFGSDSRNAAQSSLDEDTTSALHIPLLGSPLFAPLGIAPGMLLSLLIRTRREFGQEFMELLLENMMLNVLAQHLFEVDPMNGNEDGISGAPPPASQDTIDNLKEIPALEMHIAKEMKCSICHSEYELYETLAELPCQHFFHPTCVAVWLKKSGTCPVCRYQLSSPVK